MAANCTFSTTEKTDISSETRAKHLSKQQEFWWSFFLRKNKQTEKMTTLIFDICFASVLKQRKGEIFRRENSTSDNIKL